MQGMLYELNPDHVRELIKLGAVEASIMVTQETDYYGRTKTIRHDSMVHFWNKDKTEVGMATTFGNKKPCVFDEPRIWDQQHLDKHEFITIRISDFVP